MSTTTIRFDSHARHDAGAPALLKRAASQVAHTLALWQARYSQRRDLAELTPEALIDLGISAADAAAEARKPFWRA